MTVGRKDAFHTLDMDFGVFPACAMTQVDGELKHREAVLDQPVPKKRVQLPVFLGFGGKVEEYHYPHNSVLTKT